MSMLEPLTVILLTLLSVSCIGVTLVSLYHRLIHPLGLFGMIYSYFIIIPAWWFVFSDTYHYNIHNPAWSTFLTIGLCFVVYWLIVSLFIVVRYESTDIESLIGTTYDRSHTGVSQTAHRHIDLSQTMLYRLGLIGFCVGVCAYLAYVFSHGGFIRMVTVPRTSFGTGDGTILFWLLSRAGVLGGFVTVWVSLRHAVDSRTIPRTQLTALICTFVIALGTVLTYRSRTLVLVVMGIMVVYLYTTDILTDRLTIGAGCLCVGLVLVGSIGEILVNGGSTVIPMITQTVVHTPRFEALIAVIDAVPSRHAYQWGIPLVHITPFNQEWMPLVYGDQVELIATGENEKYLTFSAMLLGELWLNFGLIGVISGISVFAVVLGYIDRLSTHHTWLSQGIYPVTLIVWISLFQTNLTFSGRVLWAGVLTPLVIAIGVTYVYSHWFSRSTPVPVIQQTDD